MESEAFPPGCSGIFFEHANAVPAIEDQDMKKCSVILRNAMCLILAAVILTVCRPALGDSAIYPWINSDVEGNVRLLTRARLKDDFHLAVNKQWLLLESIPYGGTEASAFGDQSSRLMEKKISLMLDDTLTGPDAELVRALYGLTMDWDTRNALGVEPLRPYVEDIESILTLDDLADYLTTERNVFELDPSAYDVIADLSDPGRYVAILEPVPLILGDSAEYAQRTAYGDILYEIAEKSTVLMLEKLGYTEEESRAVFGGAMAFDQWLARYIRPYADHYASDYLQSILHYYTRGELSALCGDYPIAGILDLRRGKRAPVPGLAAVFPGKLGGTLPGPGHLRRPGKDRSRRLGRYGPAGRYRHRLQDPDGLDARADGQPVYPELLHRGRKAGYPGNLYHHGYRRLSGRVDR